MTVSSPYCPWVHRLAVLTACLALLPILVGALVTTKDAGMAFRDWPSSDGYNMFVYPWLQSVGDKFLEHGHRLAGALIGMVSIALVLVTWWQEPRRWIKTLATAVLLGVVAQGLLGGGRVLLNDRLLAMLHGTLAAGVFALMGSLALVTSRSWLSEIEIPDEPSVASLKPLAVITPLVLFGQYILGGLVRHLGTALHEHLALALLAAVFVLVTVGQAHRSRIAWLRRPAWWLLALLVGQLALGAGAWVSRFGLASLGYVAVHHAPAQILVQTAHAVVGLLLVMTAVIYLLRVFRLDAHRQGRLSGSAEPDSFGRLSASGESR